MASIDVIRAIARRRYSCLQLYQKWFEFGIIPCVSRDLERCYDLQKKDLTSDSGWPRDLDSVHAVAGCSLETTQGQAALAKMKRGGGTGGRESLTATMASQDHSPTSLTPSGVFAGAGRGVGQNHLRPTLFPDLSFWVKHEEECLEQLTSLSISEENTEEKVSMSNNQSVTHLLKVLKQFGVTSHPVFYRPREQRLDSTEIFCKNLFVKDKRGQFFLIICDENREMDLKWLRRKLKAYRNFSFATGYEMYHILHVEPGGVTPFALMHETSRDVRVVMTTDLTFDREALLNFHPLDQNLTLPIKVNHLEQFLQHYRVDLEYIDMDN